ncbi:hypothetical protein [Streptomyces mirabilis]|uniref:hypothetical protein n=1 Tax=Streptomyces mirabilis TaxID=68239 RepID=UPI0033B8E159
MAFGNGEALRQIGEQLGRALEDLSALKQQVSDQQLAIDQIRFDTTAAINTGLTENRAVIRDGLTRANETISDPLTQIGSELVAIRGGIGQLDNQIRAAAAAAVQRPAPEPPEEPEAAPIEDQKPAEPEPAPEPEPEAPRQVEHDLETLRAAAGVSAATLHAHRDTWEFLVKHAGRDQHFHVPGEVQDVVGAVIVKVSGPSLVAILTSLGGIKDEPGVAPGTQAIAHHLHQRIADTVKAIAVSRHTGGSADPVTIVIDDRPAPDDGSDGQSERDPDD